MRLKFFIAITLLSSVSMTQADNLQIQREQYQQLSHALKQNQSIDPAAITPLKTYPLYPYLQVEALKQDIRQQALPWKTVLSRLSDIPSTPLHGSVTNLWFQQTAQHARWDDFLTAYATLRRPSTRWQCYATWAKYQRDDDWQALAKKAQPLWLVGHSQDNACDRVFNAWFDKAPLTDDLIWQRIQKSWPKNPDLSQYLIRHLDDQAQTLTYTAINLASHPKQFFQPENHDTLKQHPLYQHFLFEAWKKISYQDPTWATQQWAVDPSVSELTTQQQQSILKNIALYLLVDGNTEGFKWADKVPERHWQTALHEWATRVALLKGDYTRAEQTIHTMPERMQKDSAWQYWKAWLLSQRGETQQAEKIWRTLINEPNWYGLLSQDALPSEKPKSTLKHHDISMPTLIKIKSDPTISVIQELRYHQEWRLVTQTWRQWVKALSPVDKIAASKIASYLKWYDLGLYAANRTPFYDRHEQAFPLAYLPLIQSHLASTTIHPAWIMSIIKQESGFSTRARSYVGAKGLMQLMPKTAAYVAKEMLSLSYHPSLLTDPEVNIALGVTYFEHLMGQLKHPIEAVAAYNAGPNALARWEHREDKVNPAIWIENIPYSQTRTYVKKVLYNYWMYEKRLSAQFPEQYDQQHTPLKQLFTTNNNQVH